MQKLLDWDEIWYLGVLESLIMIRAQHSEIQYSGSNMAEMQKSKSYTANVFLHFSDDWSFVKMCRWGFFETPTKT